MREITQMNISKLYCIKFWFVFCIGSLFLISFTNRVNARSCFYDHIIDSTKDPVQFIISLSDVVFTGKAISQWTETFESVEYPKETEIEKTIFTINSVSKGDLEPGKKVLVVGKRSGCYCIRNFLVGRSYVVYANVQDPDKNELTLKYCSYIEEVY